MKVNFKLMLPANEPAPITLPITVESHGLDVATLMLTLPNGKKVALVGVAVNQEGKLECTRWGGIGNDREFVNRSSPLDSYRIVDRTR